MGAIFSLASQSAKPRVGHTFSWLGLLLGLLAGLLIGSLGTLFYISSAHDVPIPSLQPVSGEAAIVVQLSPRFISQIVTKNVSQANIPGSLRNIQVTMAHNAPITISGDDQISVMHLGVTEHITMQLQPIIRACQPQVSITHAYILGIDLTPLLSSFDGKINQQLSNSSKTSSLPQGFAYCVTNVRTETDGIYVAYSAKPI